jgi:uncharacterized protein (TIGR02246 family)
MLDHPEDIAEAFAAAWNARDANALAALFEDDAEFVNVVGLWWHDREAIRRAHAYGLTRIFADSTLHVGTARVKPLADGVALVQVRMRLEGQTPIGAAVRPGVRTNVFTFVMRRARDSWLCAAAHNTDVVPGAETNVVDVGGLLRPADYRDGE